MVMSSNLEPQFNSWLLFSWKQKKGIQGIYRFYFSREKGQCILLSKTCLFSDSIKRTFYYISWVHSLAQVHSLSFSLKPPTPPLYILTLTAEDLVSCCLEKTEAISRKLPHSPILSDSYIYQHRTHVIHLPVITQSVCAHSKSQTPALTFSRW